MTDPAPPGSALSACPQCRTTTVSLREAEPWCPGCEWNLARFEPRRRRPELGWAPVDRHLHATAYDLSRNQFTALAEQPLDRPTGGTARVVVTVVSVVLYAIVVALLVTGVVLIVRHGPLSLMALIGVVLVALAFELRPRFGVLDRYAEVLTRDTAPTLFALVDRVATATGAPVPDIVAVDDDFNAYTMAVGPRRRRVLCLGLPLWGALGGQERVALLGHELGHFHNGDVRRGLLTQPVFTMLGVTADLIRPIRNHGAEDNFVTMIGHWLGSAVQWVLSRLLFVGHLLLVWVGMRDSQRAEYRADELAARAGGSAAAVALLDTFLTLDVVTMLVRREARAGHGPRRWRAAVAEAVAAAVAERPALRQLSVRDEVSLFAAHPPTGLRARMTEVRPWLPPTVTVTPDEVERMDAELAREYERTRRNIAWAGD